MKNIRVKMQTQHGNWKVKDRKQRYRQIYQSQQV